MRSLRGSRSPSRPGTLSLRVSAQPWARCEITRLTIYCRSPSMLCATTLTNRFLRYIGQAFEVPRSPCGQLHARMLELEHYIRGTRAKTGIAQGQCHQDRAAPRIPQERRHSPNRPNHHCTSHISVAPRQYWVEGRRWTDCL